MAQPHYSTWSKVILMGWGASQAILVHQGRSQLESEVLVYNKKPEGMLTSLHFHLCLSPFSVPSAFPSRGSATLTSTARTAQTRPSVRRPLATRRPARRPTPSSGATTASASAPSGGATWKTTAKTGRTSSTAPYPPQSAPRRSLPAD